jgi:hypothetical protein
VLPTPDWSAPWFEPWRDIGPTLFERVRAGATVAAALNEGAAPRRFVPADAAPAGEAYEAFIARTGGVPTRDNLHDLFNGGVWHLQPALKSRLNALQAAAIARDGVGPVRGPLRDALTRFDEHGALLVAPAGVRQTLLAALRRRDWDALFIGHRPLWSRARLHIVGHALLEQLVLAPRKSLTAFVFDGDALAATELQWAKHRLLPLPVAGVPGWHAANHDAAFYADDRVFRLPREGKSPFVLQVQGSDTT